MPLTGPNIRIAFQQEEMSKTEETAKSAPHKTIDI